MCQTNKIIPTSLLIMSVSAIHELISSGEQCVTVHNIIACSTEWNQTNENEHFLLMKTKRDEREVLRTEPAVCHMCQLINSLHNPCGHKHIGTGLRKAWKLCPEYKISLVLLLLLSIIGDTVHCIQLLHISYNFLLGLRLPRIGPRATMFSVHRAAACWYKWCHSQSVNEQRSITANFDFYMQTSLSSISSIKISLKHARYQEQPYN